MKKEKIKMLRAAKSVDALFGQIQDTIAAGSGQFIFRGEDKKYKFICSSLARDYLDILHIDSFDLGSVQEEQSNKIAKHTDLNRWDDVYSEIRHYGGKVNLIDFTHDYNIALFFACDDKPANDGRIILIDTSELPKLFFRIIPPKRKLTNRILTQKSVFILPLGRNYIYETVRENFITIIPVPQKLKQEIKNRLEKHHRITAEYIYCDIIGYIQNQTSYENVNSLFYKGAVFMEEKKYKKAIEFYTQYLKIGPEDAHTYGSIALANYNLKDFEGAKAAAEAAIRIYEKKGDMQAVANLQKFIADLPPDAEK